MKAKSDWPENQKFKSLSNRETPPTDSPSLFYFPIHARNLDRLLKDEVLTTPIGRRTTTAIT
ncbi:MAG: hypothetical protein EAZ09_21360 [Oscillatoriales cyanobacterium]|nr:MAG: hypothetical protein EAZ18_17925 [Oscillatoriales cyanobacterium]TAH16542.1 MAG: hypothetical protein EAZ09_21360 [Oscillatoriales cyanobacterium]